MTIDKDVKKIVLTFQEVPDAAKKGKKVDAVFGSITLKGAGKKKPEAINYVFRLNEDPNFERMIRGMILEAKHIHTQKNEQETTTRNGGKDSK